MLEIDGFEANLKIPDLWQQEALALVLAGKDVVVNAPTGAGKTYLVELLAEKSRSGQIVHSVPTRALANDKAREWTMKGWRVGIVTGDVRVDADAPLVVATLETQKSRFLNGEGPSVFVIDEYQMLGDDVRGVNYEMAIASAPQDTRLLLLSGSVSNPEDVIAWMRRIGRDAEIVSTDVRPVPLDEVFVDSLDVRPPRAVSGFWPRIVAKALMSDLGPILMFAPRRKAAEQLARKLGGALPSINPLVLSQAQKKLAGGELSKLLSKRIAYHHSGLSYQQRAGLIEPLAKAGQLRVVVSTTGLASGVNFSMRSVIVTDSEYWSNHILKSIGPDEILQMFGRAGRRGLDERGYALAVPGKVRLLEGRKLPVKRSNVLDWPSMLSMMAFYVDQGRDPFEGALLLGARLFQEEAVSLGVEFSQARKSAPCGLAIDRLRYEYSKPVHAQLLNLEGDWERVDENEVPAFVSNVWVRRSGEYLSFLTDADSVKGIGKGRLVTLARGEKAIFGKKLVVAYSDKREVDRWKLAPWFRDGLARSLKIEPAWLPRFFSIQDLDRYGEALLGSIFEQGRFVRFQSNRGRLFVVLDFRDEKIDCVFDLRGRAYLNPEIRRVYAEGCRGCRYFKGCTEDLESRRSPASSWHALGLIDGRGVPTLRGRLFSFFQNGEGLAIAASLEDEGYSVDAIALDLANVRAGFRFDDYSEFSHRLARACRLVYGDLSFDGYLSHGLPPNYGDGAAEVLAAYYEQKGAARALLSDVLRAGDVQRVRLEWLSLLKQISRSPDLEWERWRELKLAVEKLLQTDDVQLHFKDLPELEPSQTTRVNHKLHFPRGFGS